MASAESFKCARCGRVLKRINFYTMHDGSPTDLCKKCLTARVDNFNPDTFKWILEKLDVPYVPTEWNVLRDRAFTKDPNGMNGMSVLGKYISKMQLKRWKDYGYADSEKLQKELGQYVDKSAGIDKEAFEQELKDKLAKGEITETEYYTYMSADTLNQDYMNAPPPTYEEAIGENNYYNEENFIDSADLPNLAQSLSKEDKIYLAMKWGVSYKEEEWVELEKKYREMMDSFAIEDSDSMGVLILSCKTYLKMNQALDGGDIESYQKLSKVYDSLRKSAKFTAAQNKNKESDFVDCVGNLVAYCEKAGGAIPHMKLDVSYDIVDAVVKDMKKYNRDLIYEDTALARQIENYLKRRERRDLTKVKEAARKCIQEWAEHPTRLPKDESDVVMAIDAILQKRDKEADSRIEGLMKNDSK